MPSVRATESCIRCRVGWDSHERLTSDTARRNTKPPRRDCHTAARGRGGALRARRGPGRLSPPHDDQRHQRTAPRPGAVTVLTSPTARILSVFTVLCRREDLLLLPAPGRSDDAGQPPAQPDLLHGPGRDARRTVRPLARGRATGRRRPRGAGSPAGARRGRSLVGIRRRPVRCNRSATTFRASR